ncbi:MAG TPA: hypothetical protein VMV72_05010 [Verrucomicrobiae bacterium]|nr:hypothetical protein [Verrucomicrobiae bacterium]
MKGLIIAVVVVLIGYGFVQWARNFKARSDFDAQVYDQLNFVDPNSMDSVRQTLMADAKNLGIDLAADDIHIAYEDTDEQTVAESLVSKKIGVDFINKRVTITVDYVQHILGISFHHNIMHTRIKQVQAPRKRISPEMQQLLDGTQ